MITNRQALELAEPVEKMYMDVTSRLIVNIAKHFATDRGLSTRDWEIKKLSELGQLQRESVRIIAQTTGGKNKAIQEACESAVGMSLGDVERVLSAAADAGKLKAAGTAIYTSRRVQEVVENYVRQAGKDTNLVNTVMLNSVQERYKAAIAYAVDEEVAAIERMMGLTSGGALPDRLARAQEILNASAGAVNLATETRQQALRKAVRDMARVGITGYIDIGGHHWSPEAYVNMDIRTTVHNTAIQGQKARSEDYGVYTFQVSTKAAARPLCAPWQGHILSWQPGDSGIVTDLYGKEYRYISVYDTSYGEPAGLFGINCGHFPQTFVDGYSVPRYKELTPEEEEANAKAYELSQKQRGLERSVREAKTEAAALKASGDEEGFERAAVRVKRKQDAYADFCEENGLTERKDRLQVGTYGRSEASSATWAAKRAAS